MGRAITTILQYLADIVTTVGRSDFPILQGVHRPVGSGSDQSPAVAGSGDTPSVRPMPRRGDREEADQVSQDNSGMRLCLALNYGSRGEIADAARDIAVKVATGELKPEDIDEATVSDHLYTAGMPDPDLLIRTAGELRISNYLLWQISYAELWVTEKFWPEFRPPDLIEAFQSFAARDRRYGGLKT